MKKYSKFVMMLLMGTLTMGFSACSDDDEEEETELLQSDPDYDNDGGDANACNMKEIVRTYLNDVVNPTYKSLADNTQILYDACQTLNSKGKAGTLTQADIDAACDAFKNARREWEQSEAFLYGAATDNDIDPHIDSWPLDHSQLVEALNDNSVISGINGENPAKYVYDNNGNFDSVLGFHGLEFVLFRNGANRTLAAINNGKETESGLESVSTLDELAFAAAVSGDLRNMIFLLEYGWGGNNVSTAHKEQLNAASWVVSNTRYAGLSPASISYTNYLLRTKLEAGYFTKWQETLQNIFIGGCSNICNEVYNQKLGQAYRVATGVGEEEDAGDYIESPYSKRSFIDYQDNIRSIRNSLYGARNVDTPVENSLMTYMKNKNYSGYSTLNTALDEAITALQTAIDSGIAFVDNPGHQQVKTCIDKIEALDNALNEAGSWIAKQAEE